MWLGQSGNLRLCLNFSIHQSWMLNMTGTGVEIWHWPRTRPNRGAEYTGEISHLLLPLTTNCFPGDTNSTSSAYPSWTVGTGPLYGVYTWRQNVSWFLFLSSLISINQELYWDLSLAVTFVSTSCHYINWSRAAKVEAKQSPTNWSYCNFTFKSLNNELFSNLNLECVTLKAGHKSQARDPCDEIRIELNKEKVVRAVQSSVRSLSAHQLSKGSPNVCSRFAGHSWPQQCPAHAPDVTDPDLRQSNILILSVYQVSSLPCPTWWPAAITKHHGL